MSRNRRREWQVEVEHTPTGNIVEPPVVGSPTRTPQVNGLPEIKIPVKKSSKWDKTVWDDAPLTVYYKGERQNIEQLERVEQREGETILIGRGGIELRNIVNREFKRERSAVVAGDLITDATSYTADTTKVTGDTDENVTVDTRTTTSEFQNALDATDTSTIPVTVDNGSVKLQQSCFTDNKDGVASAELGFDRYVNASAPTLGGEFGQFGDTISTSFTPQYDLDSSNLSIDARFEPFDSTGDGEYNDGPPLTITINGPDIAETSIGGFADRHSFAITDLRWQTIASYGGSTLSAGNTYTITIELDKTTDDTYDEFVVDVLAPYDTRFNYTFDNQVNSPGGHLDGPELFPDSLTVDFDQVPAPRGVSGVRAETTFDNTTGNQALAVSNDGTTFKSAQNTQTIEKDFTDVGSGVTLRATFSRYGSQTGATPLTGIEGQQIDDYTLKADLTSAPFVIDQTFNDQARRALNSVARTGDFVWEFQIDNDGTKRVVFTPSDSRTDSRDVPINNFSIKTDNAKVYQRIILFGSTTRVDGESVTLATNPPASLNNDYLVEASETVRDASTDTLYERGVDYNISYKDGTIEPTGSGALSAGDVVTISYSQRVRASVTDSNAPADPNTEVVTVPEASTPELAEVVARRIVEKVSVVEETVDITIPADVPRVSAVEALQIEDLPSEKVFQIKSVEATPDEIVIRAGTRESLDVVTEQLQSQLKTVSKKA